MNLSYQTAYSINQLIDTLHNPSWWILGGVVAVLGLMESYLPAREFLFDNFEKFMMQFKFTFMVLFDVVFYSQGIFGGCLIQIPQNLIAKAYLGREYWYPFGLVYREYLPVDLWPALRAFYVLLGLFAIYRTAVFYYKFLKDKPILIN